MKSYIIRSFIFACSISLGVVPFKGAILNFNSVGPTGNSIQSGTLSVAGYDFTSSSFHVIDDPSACAGGCIDFGSEELAVVAPGLDSPVTITAIGGGPFSLASLDAARLFLTPAGIGSFVNADTLNLQGSLSGGGTVSGALMLESEGMVGSYSVNGFTDLSALTISGSYLGGDASFAVDNLDLLLAPEPSYFAILLAAGLLLVTLHSVRILRLRSDKA